MSLVDTISALSQRVATEIKSVKKEKPVDFDWNEDGSLKKVTYASGNTKTPYFINGVLMYSDYLKYGVTYRTTYYYDANGAVSSTTEAIIT